MLQGRIATNVANRCFLLLTFIGAAVALTGCEDDEIKPYEIQDITIEGRRLLPDFEILATDYSAEVDYETDTIIFAITTIKQDKKDLKIEVNGQEQSSNVVSLKVGVNTIVIQSRSDTRLAYTFSVTRAHSAYLSEINVISEPFGTSALLNNEFDKYNSSLVYVFPRAVSTVLVNIKPEDQTSSYTMKSTGRTKLEQNLVKLEIGDNVVLIETKSSDKKSTRTYELHIIRQPLANANVKSLSFSKGELVPEFSADQTEYHLFLGKGDKTFEYSVALEDSLATYSLTTDGAVTTSSTLSSTVLNKDFHLDVFADNGFKKTVRVTVSRQGWDFVGYGPFAARDGAGILEFRGRLWLIGGWKNGPTTSEVWSSADGTNWQLETVAPWLPRHCAGYVVFKDKMWIVSGDGISDVWASEDGVNWSKVLDNAPWGRRYSPYVVTHKNKIYLMGGLDFWSAGPPIAYNDVWSSEDGANWTKVVDKAPWEPRGLIHGQAVFKDKIWIIAGGTKASGQTSAEYRDVWSSADGINWELATDNVPWKGRTHVSVAVFDNRLWMTDGSVGQQNELSNEIWYSDDGVIWKELERSPTRPTHASSVLAFNNQLYAICGYIHRDIWKLSLD